ncbi:MAG: hypothetical protein J5I90_00630 [Caldilineales bacterium]|nr:hypothetical protein [Caldilineales bacterium]
MSQALQTDISILRLDRGHRDREAPTVRAVEPDRGIAPAEGKGNLYILLEVDGSGNGLPRLYRELLSTIQETYYYYKGDIAQSLTAALRAAHAYIQQHNQYHSTDFVAGATCLVATGGEIVSAQAGPTILAVQTDVGLQWFSPLNDENFSSLGEQATPSVEIGRVEGAPGVVVVAMSSSWANYLEVSLMNEATKVPRAQAVADQLAGIGIDAKEELTLLVVTFTAAGSGAGKSASPAPAVATQRPAAAPTESWDDDATDEEWEQEQADAEQASQVGGIRGRRLRRKQAAAEKAQAKPEKAEKKTRGAPSRRVPYALAIVAVLIIGALAVTAGMWYLQGRERADLFERYITGAEVNWQAAVGTTDENQARLYLQAAEEQLAQAAFFFPNHPKVETIRNHIAETQAVVNHVQPILAGFDVPLTTFSDPEREPVDVFVSGLNVYVMDRGMGTLNRYRLDEATGDRLANDGEAETLLTSGQTVGGRRIGELAHAVWAPATGNRTASGPLVLDRSNQLFSTVEGLGPINVATSDNPDLVFVADMDYYSGNLYLLDTNESQLWRYRPTGDSYTEAPEAYFSAENPVNISSVVDAAIDGSVWLLHPNGTILKFFGGEQEAFALDVVDPPIGDAVALWANEADIPGGRLYIGDGASNRILVFDKQGKLLSQLMPAGQPGVLNDLRSLWVDEATGYLYALTASALYQAPLPPIENPS